MLLKQQMGCWLHERRQAELALQPFLSALSRTSWIDLCNRHEKAEIGDDKEARYVESEFTSYLTVARKFPKVGGRLARTCFRQNPLPELRNVGASKCLNPQLSVILPVGGKDRLQNFELVLLSLMNQSFTAIEIIVLEHSIEPLYDVCQRYGTRYEHRGIKSTEEEFNKSLLMNNGVELSRASTVLLHDADILVPRDYLWRSFERINRGYDAVRPLRHLFYADPNCTESIYEHRVLPSHPEFKDIAQNSLGGSTMIRKKAYSEIGGHDQSFEGWGGEDLEFLERLRLRKLFRGGFMPAIHLWHPVAKRKANGDRNLKVLTRLRAVDPAERISRLRAAGSRVR